MLRKKRQNGLLTPEDTPDMRKPKAFQVFDGDFRTSSWTGGVIARCVQIAKKPEGVAVRDSKDARKTTLYFTHEEWEAFLNGAKAGEFD